MSTKNELSNYIAEVCNGCPNEMYECIDNWCDNTDATECVKSLFTDKVLLDDEVAHCINEFFKIVVEKGNKQYSQTKINKILNIKDKEKDKEAVKPNQPPEPTYEPIPEPINRIIKDDEVNFTDYSQRKTMDDEKLTQYYTKNFKEYFNNHFERLINANIQMKNITKSIAELCHDLIKEYFVYCKGKIYYCNNSNLWTTDDNNENLLGFISKHLAILINVYEKELSIYVLKDKDQVKAQKHIRQSAEIVQNINKKNDIIKELKTNVSFKNDIFTDKLDNHRSFVIFNNGVYDGATGKFGRIKQEYLLTNKRYINYNYKHPVEIVDFDVKKDFYKKYLDKVLDESAIFYLQLFSKTLIEDNVNNYFDFHLGSGGNGKSMLKTHTMEVFGGNITGYCNVLDASYFNAKLTTASSSASPELAALIGSRMCIVDEGNNKQSLDIGKLKKLTGGDIISCRNLFNNQSILKPEFHIHYYSNVLPLIHKDELTDDGLIRRIICIPYKAKFCLKEPTILEEGESFHLIDNDLKPKLYQDDIKMVAFHYIMEHYTKQPLNIPNHIEEFTVKKLYGSDPFYEFLKMYIDAGQYNPKANHFDYVFFKDVFANYKTIMLKDDENRRRDEYMNITKDFMAKNLSKMKIVFKYCHTGNNKPIDYIHNIDEYLKGNKTKTVYATSRDIFLGIKYNEAFFEKLRDIKGRGCLL